MKQKRTYRWTFFAIAACSFLYVVWIHAAWWAVGIFFVSGSAWYWLERRKTRELDAPYPRNSIGPKTGP